MGDEGLESKWVTPATELKTSARLIIGPNNFAGQSTAWARAVDSWTEGASAHSLSFDRAPFNFASDYLIDESAYLDDKSFRAPARDYLTKRYTHFLLESNRAFFGQSGPRDVREDLSFLRAHGRAVALMAHGTDVRLPSLHLELEPWSPFSRIDPHLAQQMEGMARRAHRLFNAFPGRVFVSTPDLLQFVDGAAWCPVVIDAEHWHSDHGVLERDRPVVAHAPSKAHMKGSELIDASLEALHDEGLIEYRRVEGMKPEQMPSVYQDADIVIDQLALGSYGVAACEAMGAGRVVLGHVSVFVRDHVRQSTGLDVPIVEVTPDTIVGRIRELVSDPVGSREIAARSYEFVREVHDGRVSGAVLGEFTAEPPRPDPEWLTPTLGHRVAMLSSEAISEGSTVMNHAQAAGRWGADVIAFGVDLEAPGPEHRVGPVSVRQPPTPRHWAARRSYAPLFLSEQSRRQALDTLAADRRRSTEAEGRSRRDFRRELIAPVRRSPRVPATTGLRVRRQLIRLRSLFLVLRRVLRQPASAPALPAPAALSSLARASETRAREKDLETIFGPRLDRLRPDAIHVHDPFMLGVAARAAGRAASRGRTTVLIYHRHGTLAHPSGVDLAIEQQFIADADVVVASSIELADELRRRHDLVSDPVVAEAPPSGAAAQSGAVEVTRRTGPGNQFEPLEPPITVDWSEPPGFAVVTEQYVRFLGRRPIVSVPSATG